VLCVYCIRFSCNGRYCSGFCWTFFLPAVAVDDFLSVNDDDIDEHYKYGPLGRDGYLSLCCMSNVQRRIHGAVVFSATCCDEYAPSSCTGWAKNRAIFTSSQAISRRKHSVFGLYVWPCVNTIS